MSRIEEALRRTGRVATVTDEESLPSSDGQTPRRASALEQYPIEPPRPRQTRPPKPQPEPERVPEPAATIVRAEPAANRSPSLDRTAGAKLVVGPEASPVSVEQYRRLAATLYQAQSETGLKSIMVSSALPREGKTLTATNLALTLAESYGQRVLLIDADLRGPSIHSLFRLSNAPGLADYLHADGGQLPIVEVSGTLSVLTAGNTNGNPIAGLVSDRMKKVVEEAASRFDWVVLDTPPVGLLPDANLLARLADAVVFVVAAASSPYALVQRAVSTVGADRVIGVVLNRAAGSSLPNNAYYDNYAAGSRRSVDLSVTAGTDG
jgi:protein-tyrosine kinase